jgi:hypothetical protein
VTSTLSYICCNKLRLCLAVDVSNHGRFFGSGQSYVGMSCSDTYK